MSYKNYVTYICCVILNNIQILFQASRTDIHNYESIIFGHLLLRIHYSMAPPGLDPEEGSQRFIPFLVGLLGFTYIVIWKNICMWLNFIFVFICHLKKKIVFICRIKKFIHECVYMFWTLEKVFVCCSKLRNKYMSHNAYTTCIYPLRSICRLPIYVG